VMGDSLAAALFGVAPRIGYLRAPADLLGA
jgi:hypothetical protein